MEQSTDHMEGVETGPIAADRAAGPVVQVKSPQQPAATVDPLPDIPTFSGASFKPDASKSTDASMANTPSPIPPYDTGDLTASITRHRDSAVLDTTSASMHSTKRKLSDDNVPRRATSTSSQPSREASRTPAPVVDRSGSGDPSTASSHADGTPKPRLPSKSPHPTASVANKTPAKASKPPTASVKAKKASAKKGTAQTKSKKRAKQSPKGALGSSTPNSALPLSGTSTPGQEVDEMEEDEDEEDSSLYCFCRAPDDHTTMVACDGPCQDWYHARCIGLASSEPERLEAYFCEFCHAQGAGTTLWKRLCRNPTCDKLARGVHTTKVVDMDDASEDMDSSSTSKRAVITSGGGKYCSDTCGVALFGAMLALARAGDIPPPSKCKGRNTPTATTSTTSTKGIQESHSQPRPTREHNPTAHPFHPAVGGRLRPSELRSLIDASPSYEHFARLGNSDTTSDGSTTPPTSLTMKDLHLDDANPVSTTNALPTLQTHLHQARSALTLAHQKLQLLQLIEAHIPIIAATLPASLSAPPSKPKPTTTTSSASSKRTATVPICGYDYRLQLATPRFAAWFATEAGQAMLASGGRLGPVEQDSEWDRNETGADGKMVSWRGVCVKKRCERHRGWREIHQRGFGQDVVAAREAVGVLEGRIGALEGEQSKRRRGREGGGSSRVGVDGEERDGEEGGEGVVVVCLEEEQKGGGDAVGLDII